MIEIILLVILSYLCGSIPFGLILTKIFNKKDIRKIGSGNIGATNVLRTGNKLLALTTLLFDILKGFLPVLISKQYFPEFIYLCSLFAFFGHIFPIWLKFRGGKGVATFLGILFGLSYSLAFLFIFTWIVVFLIFKFSSVSSIFATMTVFVITFIKDTALKSINQNFVVEDNLKLILFIFFILILFTHKKNISNLKNKTEQKIKL
tara:strand:- start:190 stop:804 length:615 start_codon:yes stop_codon:yes gene_type:complete